MMKRLWMLAGYVSLVCAISGCAMCDHPFDYTYAAFGGTWERDNPVGGRVGSVLDPAGSSTISAADADRLAVDPPALSQDDEPSVLRSQQAEMAELLDLAPSPDMIILQ